MTGNANTTTRTHIGWFRQLQQIPRHYFAIDGGSGAHLLAALTECNPYVKQVASPRHADVLLIVEPISQKLVPALREIAKALPRPAHVLIIGEPEGSLEYFSRGELARVEDLMPGSRRIPRDSIESVVDVMLRSEPWLELEPGDIPEPEAATIQLPGKQEQEMATELAVLSLGPVQPFTAGPLRIFLICDGEQVLSAQVESGYAHRGIDQAMMQATWLQSLTLARHFDPLAPIAGQLAYVSGVEHIQRWQPPIQVVKLREAALAIERAQNVLWWLVRFVRILDDVQLSDRSYQLATKLAECTGHLWQQSPDEWVMPQENVTTSVVNKNTAPRLQQISEHVEALRRDVERNRLLALRTREIGVLTVERLKSAGVSGPVLQGSEQADGDVQSRLVVRLQSAAIDLREAAEVLAVTEMVPAHTVSWDVPIGEANVAVKGPRGMIGLHLGSSPEGQPAHVEWQRPSAALLPILSEILSGQKLVDAEAIVASLDLAMAEVDG